MSTVLATLDATAAGRPVLETALRVGELTATSVRVLHVRSDPRQSSETPESLARRSGVAFELLEGKVDQALLSGIENPDVVAVVIGARGDTRRAPTGRAHGAVHSRARRQAHRRRPTRHRRPTRAAPSARPARRHRAVVAADPPRAVATAGRRRGARGPPRLHRPHPAGNARSPPIRPRDIGPRIFAPTLSAGQRHRHRVATGPSRISSYRGVA